MVLALLACSAVPPVVGEPPIGPNLWRSWPYSPDLGSLVDPRVEGCRVKKASEDGISVGTWVYDARGRATSEHLLWELDGSAYDYRSRYTWGAEDCMRRSYRMNTSAGSTYESRTDWACDARGNPLASTWVTEGEITGGVSFWNEYDDQGRLVARELTREDGSPYYEESFTYDGGWLWSYASRNQWAEEVTTSWTTGADGRIEAWSEEQCALDGAAECGEREAVTYTFDGAGALVAADGMVRAISFMGGGRVDVYGGYTWSAVYTADERGLPSSAEYTFDDGWTGKSLYTLTCDGPQPPGPVPNLPVPTFPR